MFVLIYVDDTIVTGTDSQAISELIPSLQKEFALKDLGPLSYFLGIHATREANGLYLHQSKYILDLLHKSKMVGAKPCNTCCSSGSKLSIFDGSSLADPIEYRHIVRELQYCTLTCPDIAFSVNQLCQFMYSPIDRHWTAVKHVFRYLKAIVDHGLHYSKSSLQLNAYCNSNWVGALDDRRSISGFEDFFCFSLIS